MNEILRLKEDYYKGLMTKIDYALAIGNKLKTLKDVNQAMEGTIVEEIRIIKNDTIFYIKLPYEDIQLKLSCDAAGLSGIPECFIAFKDVEYSELKLISKLIENGDVIFDVGANVGWYSITLKMLFSNIKVYSFEPIPSTFNILKKNLLLNDQHDDLAFNYGLSDINDSIEFYFDNNFPAASSIKNLEYTSDVQPLTCTVRRMDDFIDENNIQKLDFIKCDVEGAELLVMKGGLKSIEKFKPVIFLEMLRKWTRKFDYHPNDIITLLKSIGYKCFVIDDNDQLMKFEYVDDDTVFTNYFFIHNSKEHMYSDVTAKG